MSEDIDKKNPIPGLGHTMTPHSDVSQEEIEALQAAANEMEEYLSEPPNEWCEMDDTYYTHLRERFGKGVDEIGPRTFKQFQNDFLPIQMMVIPAGRQHNGEEVVSYYHVLAEDMEAGECNGSHELLTEQELESKFNIKYNN